MNVLKGNRPGSAGIRASIVCLVIAASAALFIASTGWRETRADEVIDWNARALAAMSAKPPAVASRIMAAMHCAMQDATNAVEQHDRPCRFSVMVRRGASKEAAAAAAAHGVLVAMVPHERAALDAAFAAALGRIPESAEKRMGVAVGMAAARSMIASRTGDGFEAEAADKVATGPVGSQ
jgi:hypothetical protein